MANVVTVSGMFGEGKTYFAGSPVVIDISGLKWSRDGQAITSPFTIVRVYVDYDGKEAGGFHADTGGQTSISFDISSALRAIWSDFDFAAEVEKAREAIVSTSVDGRAAERPMREYTLRIYTEYMASDDGGVFTQTQCVDEHGNTDIPGGQCLPGSLTEWERASIARKEDADVSHWEHTGVRNGDASTKPTLSPERVGKSSITSWVDVQQGYTKSIFYPAAAPAAADDSPTSPEGWDGHAPVVLRDDIDYTDFLFVNRRGAVETCSGLTLEAMSVEVETKQYSRIERPTFKPSRTLMAVASGGRRSWQMSSGIQTREWADWWSMEFLMARQWWMRYPFGDEGGTFVPVVVTPAKKSTDVYDRSKQGIPHVDFTVALAFEG